MEYVMVPVPDELVDEVKDFLNWQLAVPQESENPEALAMSVADLDDTLRALVFATAHATVDEVRPTLRDIAEQVGVSMREIVGALAELNGRLRSHGRATPLVLIRADPRPRPDDVTEWEHRILHMTAADSAVVLGSETARET